jgi:hypothetical protein
VLMIVVKVVVVASSSSPWVWLAISPSSPAPLSLRTRRRDAVFAWFVLALSLVTAFYLIFVTFGAFFHRLQPTKVGRRSIPDSLGTFVRTPRVIIVRTALLVRGMMSHLLSGLRSHKALVVVVAR